MGLIDWLSAVGGKLKIIQVTPAREAPAPEKLPTRTVRLKDLITEIQADQVRSLAHQPQEIFDGFDRIFQAAGIQSPPNGWTVEKLRDLLKTEPFKSMDRPAAQQALVVKLVTDKVSAEDLVKDAMARDKALDAFEETARVQIRQREDARKRKAADLQAQVEALRKQCQDLEAEGRSELSQWHQWHAHKVDFEKEMAWAIGYLMDKPVVTVDKDGP